MNDLSVPVKDHSVDTVFAEKYQKYCNSATELKVEPVPYETFVQHNGNICFSPRAGRS